MSRDPVLILGGAGFVGRHAARFLGMAHPDAALLIGGRDLAKAREAAAGLPNAVGVGIDLARDDLGLGERPVAAVATLFTDASGASLSFAQRRGAGHISISPRIVELGPEVAAFMAAPRSAAVVLGTEWLVGATSLPTLALAKSFGRLREIAIGALLDERDDFGPAAHVDLERQGNLAAALVRRGGAWEWRTGADARSSFRAADGSEVEATAFSPNDVLALANETGAPDIRFDVAIGTSSSRRRGEPLSTEIVIALAGEDRAGRPLRTRHAVVHPQGQMPLTGLGVALVLERLAGLDGRLGVPPGLYFPSQLIDPGTYPERLRAAGGRLIDLGS